MASVTISPTAEQLSAYGPDFDLLRDRLADEGLDAGIEPRSTPRGPLVDVLVYVSDHAAQIVIEVAVLEALRRLRRRKPDGDAPPPRRFLLVDENGDGIKTVELTNESGA